MIIQGMIKLGVPVIPRQVPNFIERVRMPVRPTSVKVIPVSRFLIRPVGLFSLVLPLSLLINRSRERDPLGWAFRDSHICVLSGGKIDRFDNIKGVSLVLYTPPSNDYIS